MKLREFPLLTDENLDPNVVSSLRQFGFDVLDVVESGLQGSTDVKQLRLATTQGRVVVTHDAGFGTLAIHQNEPLVGLAFLRPGHIDPQFTIDTVRSILNADPDIFPPFVLVAKRTGDNVTIRVRHLKP
jgi:predicted nuclease of predicted toxin-antitoxin system